MRTNVQDLVDLVLDLAEAVGPDNVYRVTLSAPNTLLLPRDPRSAQADVDAGMCFESRHVYRGCIVRGIRSVRTAPIDHLVIASPAAGMPTADAPTIYGDLRTHRLTTSLPVGS